MNKLVVFDMDGLLVDSEILHLKAWRNIFDENGLVLQEEDYVREWVQGGRGIVQYVEKMELFPIEERLTTALKIRENKKILFDAMLEEELEIKPGAKELLENLDGKMKMVIASSSYRKSLEIIVKKFGIDKYFERIISIENVQKAKPDPEIFLLAAKEMKVKPSECVVLEDAEKGLKAAKAAGMKCIIVPDVFTLNGDFKKADLVVNSLTELNYHKIKNL
jgi:HAD superfamily hydrolase (TIGR01509 family)